MTRVVLDTNVLLAALISPYGAPHAVFRAWRAARFELLTSAAQLDELRRASLLQRRHLGRTQIVTPGVARGGRRGRAHDQLVARLVRLGRLQVDAGTSA